MDPAELDKLIRDDKTATNYRGQPDANGLYDVGGVKYPRVAVGQCAIIMLSTPSGGYELVVSQRAKHLTQGGRWAMLGGYMNVDQSEGPLNGIYREVREESNQKIDLAPYLPRPLVPYMDYTDNHNNACFCMGYLFVICGKDADAMRQSITDAIKTKDFDSEVMDMALLPVDAGLAAAIQARGGLGYEHEMRFLQQAVAIVAQLGQPCMVPSQQPKLFAPPALPPASSAAGASPPPLPPAPVGRAVPPPLPPARP